MTWPPELTNELVRLWTSGKTTYAIRDELGLTRNQVVGKLNRMGHLGKKPRRTGTQKSQRKLVIGRAELGWDMRTTMPWEHRKILRQMEREQGLPFRALEHGNGLR